MPLTYWCSWIQIKTLIVFLSFISFIRFIPFACAKINPASGYVIICNNPNIIKNHSLTIIIETEPQAMCSWATTELSWHTHTQTHPHRVCAKTRKKECKSFEQWLWSYSVYRGCKSAVTPLSASHWIKCSTFFLISFFSVLSNRLHALSLCQSPLDEKKKCGRERRRRRVSKRYNEKKRQTFLQHPTRNSSEELQMKIFEYIGKKDWPGCCFLFTLFSNKVHFPCSRFFWLFLPLKYVTIFLGAFGPFYDSFSLVLGDIC